MSNSQISQKPRYERTRVLPDNVSRGIFRKQFKVEPGVLTEGIPWQNHGTYYACYERRCGCSWCWEFRRVHDAVSGTLDTKSAEATRAVIVLRETEWAESLEDVIIDEPTRSTRNPSLDAYNDGLTFGALRVEAPAEGIGWPHGSTSAASSRCKCPICSVKKKAMEWYIRYYGVIDGATSFGDYSAAAWILLHPDHGIDPILFSITKIVNAGGSSKYLRLFSDNGVVVPEQPSVQEVVAATVANVEAKRTTWGEADPYRELVQAVNYILTAPGVKAISKPEIIAALAERGINEVPDGRLTRAMKEVGVQFHRKEYQGITLYSKSKPGSYTNAQAKKGLPQSKAFESDANALAKIWKPLFAEGGTSTLSIMEEMAKEAGIYYTDGRRKRAHQILHVERIKMGGGANACEAIYGVKGAQPKVMPQPVAATPVATAPEAPTQDRQRAAEATVSEEEALFETVRQAHGFDRAVEVLAALRSTEKA